VAGRCTATTGQARSVDAGPDCWNLVQVRVVMLRLLRDVPCPQGEAAAVVAALRAGAEPPDGLEHVYAQVGPDGLDVVLFLTVAADDDAETVARSLVDRATERALPGYRLLFAHTDVRLTTHRAPTGDLP
jgi:hypothetical protein